jgi:predicted Zn-dependent protease
MADIKKLEAMLARGRDSALLRFSIGSAYLGEQNAPAAIGHLQSAVAQDPKYSAAWKLLGKALAQEGDNDAACSAYESGIEVALAKGDKQAAKEMTVFARRLQKLKS